MGNLQEISPATWRSGITAIAQRYPDARIVVPGHGAIGDLELVRHTGELLQANAPQGK
jgi:metallo-beta-lactamase class B